METLSAADLGYKDAPPSLATAGNQGFEVALSTPMAADLGYGEEAPTEVNTSIVASRNAVHACW